MRLKSVLKKSDGVESLLALLQGMLFAFKQHEALVIEVRRYEPDKKDKADLAESPIMEQQIALVQQILHESELTQKQLAIKIGMAPSILCGLLKGRERLTHASAQKFIRGHHLSPERAKSLMDLAAPIARFQNRK